MEITKTREEDYIFKDKDSLIDAFIAGHLDLDTYLNEWNHLTRLESEAMMKAEPVAGKEYI